MKFRLTYLLVLLLTLTYQAVSQQQHGTVVVFKIFPDHAIVSADSRTVHRCAGKPIVHDDVCKILKLDDKFVFAVSGDTGRFDPCDSTHMPWNIRQITKDVFKGGNILTVDDFAAKWADRTLDVITADSKIAPLEPAPDGVVMVAIFVSSSKVGISADSVIIRFRPNGRLEASRGNLLANGQQSDMGNGAIIKEFNANQTKRAKVWHSKIDKLGADGEVSALAKLTEEINPSGDVGGPIDTVRVGLSGIKWLSVKSQCSDR